MTYGKRISTPVSSDRVQSLDIPPTTSVISLAPSSTPGPTTAPAPASATPDVDVDVPTPLVVGLVVETVLQKWRGSPQADVMVMASLLMLLPWCRSACHGPSAKSSEKKKKCNCRVTQQTRRFCLRHCTGVHIEPFCTCGEGDGAKATPPLVHDSLSSSTSQAVADEAEGDLVVAAQQPSKGRPTLGERAVAKPIPSALPHVRPTWDLTTNGKVAKYYPSPHTRPHTTTRRVIWW